MKKLVLAAVLSVLFKANAQDVVSQSEQINSLKTGTYIAFDVKKNKNGNYNYIELKGEHELIAVNPEPNFSEHNYFEIKIYGDDYNFIPDNMAFPITYARLFYEGNAKLKKQVGYVPRKIRPGSTNRICVVDGIIFDLGTNFNPNKPDTFKPYRLYVHEDFGKDFKPSENKKKKLSLKERMEQSMMKKIAKSKGLQGVYNSIQKLDAMDAVNLVQDYLKTAIAKQQAVEPKWKSISSNTKRLQLVEARRELMNIAIKKYNDDLMDTPEWRRIQENNRLAASAAAKNNVTLKNDTGREIYIYAAGSMNGSRLSNGASSTFSCSTTYYYAFNSNAGSRHGNAGPLAYSANSGCGSTVSIK
jgi:hypothetical protein